MKKSSDIITLFKNPINKNVTVSMQQDPFQLTQNV